MTDHISQPSNNQQLTIPLEFWFCRNTSLAIPEQAVKFCKARDELHRRALEQWYIFKAEEDIKYGFNDETTYVPNENSTVVNDHDITTDISEEEFDKKPMVTELERCLEYFQSTSPDPTKGPLYSETNLVNTIVKAVILNRGSHFPTVKIVYNDVEYNVRKLNCGAITTFDNRCDNRRNNKRGKNSPVTKSKFGGIMFGNVFIGQIAIDGVIQLIKGHIVSSGKFSYELRDDTDSNDQNTTMQQLISLCEKLSPQILTGYFRTHFRLNCITPVLRDQDSGVTFVGTNGQSFIIQHVHCELYCHNEFDMGQIVNLDFDLDVKVGRFIDVAFTVGSFMRAPKFNYGQMIQYLKLVDILGFSVNL